MVEETARHTAHGRGAGAGGLARTKSAKALVRAVRERGLTPPPGVEAGEDGEQRE